MQHTLPKLPYALDALTPHISKETLELHYGKHHQTYVTNLNKLLVDSEFATASLEEIILKTSGNSDFAGLFNNAAQVWNHTFYWHCLSPNGGGEPTGTLKEMIEKKFGSLETFKAEFKTACLTQFGSGWAWLVQEGSSLKIVKTPNAETPMTKGLKPLLTCDVWEHAYYVDYQNRRPDYVDTFLAHLVNWDFVAQQLDD
ncbi:MAG: superoxide dismutase [Fe] [Alphaproteobacteria bacterium CG_4_10_14_0_8_um_filter_37_21]|nr:MAG: superoxide dismutase [Fe] [Alphaproteobacteria bacterium CG_4_10_14_0_8_um_filter_37_21]